MYVNRRRPARGWAAMKFILNNGPKAEYRRLRERSSDALDEAWMGKARAKRLREAERREIESLTAVEPAS